MDPMIPTLEDAILAAACEFPLYYPAEYIRYMVTLSWHDATRQSAAENCPHILQWVESWRSMFQSPLPNPGLSVLARAETSNRLQPYAYSVHASNPQLQPRAAMYSSLLPSNQSLPITHGPQLRAEHAPAGISISSNVLPPPTLPAPLASQDFARPNNKIAARSDEPKKYHCQWCHAPFDTLEKLKKHIKKRCSSLTGHLCGSKNCGYLSQCEALSRVHEGNTSPDEVHSFVESSKTELGRKGYAIETMGCSSCGRCFYASKKISPTLRYIEHIANGCDGYGTPDNHVRALLRQASLSAALQALIEEGCNGADLKDLSWPVARHGTIIQQLQIGPRKTARDGINYGIPRKDLKGWLRGILQEGYRHHQSTLTSGPLLGVRQQPSSSLAAIAPSHPPATTMWATSTLPQVPSWQQAGGHQASLSHHGGANNMLYAEIPAPSSTGAPGRGFGVLYPGDFPVHEARVPPEPTIVTEQSGYSNEYSNAFPSLPDTPQQTYPIPSWPQRARRA